MKTKTQIEEPLNPFDFWHMILARSPLNPGTLASKVALFIYFENWGFA
jgi:hypothetical protein